MHELSVCRSIVSIVDAHRHGRPVETVGVRLGQLRQIVPDTLAYCWSLVTAETALAGSTLDVQTIPVRLTCESCGHVTDLGDVPRFACAACGGSDVTVTSGEEFLVTSLTLAEVAIGEGAR